MHVADIVGGTLAGPQRTPGTYNLGTGRGTSLNDLAKMLTVRLAPHCTPMHAPAAAGELRYSVADIDSARKLLGYQPARTLEGEIAAVIDDIRGRR